MVTAEQQSRLDKSSSRIDKLVSSGKITSQEAKKRKADARASILGTSPGGAKAPASSSRPRVSTRQDTVQARLRDIDVEGSEVTFNKDRKRFLCNMFELTDLISPFRNVSVPSVSFRFVSSLGAKPENMRIACCFLAAKPEAEKMTYANVMTVVGALGFVAPFEGNRHTISVPSSFSRVAKRNGEVQEHELWFAMVYESSDEKLSLTGGIGAPYQCSGGVVGATERVTL